MTGESDDSSTVFFCPNFSKAVMGKIASDLILFVRLNFCVQEKKNKTKGPKINIVTKRVKNVRKEMIKMNISV
ncbi:hypothetical protein P5673_016663, partial [Acropora cervicornis]